MPIFGSDLFKKMLKIYIWDPKIVMFPHKCQKTLVVHGKYTINYRYYGYKQQQKRQFFFRILEETGTGFGQKLLKIDIWDPIISTTNLRYEMTFWFIFFCNHIIYRFVCICSKKLELH